MAGSDANNLARQLIAKEKAEALSQQSNADAQNSATYEGDYARIVKEAPKEAPKDAPKEAPKVAPNDAPNK